MAPGEINLEVIGWMLIASLLSGAALAYIDAGEQRNGDRRRNERLDLAELDDRNRGRRNPHAARDVGEAHSDGFDGDAEELHGGR